MIHCICSSCYQHCVMIGVSDTVLIGLIGRGLFVIVMCSIDFCTLSILSVMLCVVEYSFLHYKHSQNYLYQIAGLNATYRHSLKMSGWRLDWSVRNLWCLKLARNQHLGFWTFCLAYFGVNIHRDIILANNFHPFLSQTFSYDGRQCSTYHHLNWPVNWGVGGCAF